MQREEAKMDEIIDAALHFNAAATAVPPSVSRRCVRPTSPPPSLAIPAVVSSFTVFGPGERSQPQEAFWKANRVVNPGSSASNSLLDLLALNSVHTSFYFSFVIYCLTVCILQVARHLFFSVCHVSCSALDGYGCIRFLPASCLLLLPLPQWNRPPRPLYLRTTSAARPGIYV